MGLLDSIRNDAIDGKTDLAGVLRKCIVLAYKLGHEPFRDWVNQELNGYEDYKTLPDYRIVPVSIRFNAVNVAWRLTGQQFRSEMFPPELQTAASTGYFTQSVGVLEALKDKDDLHLSPPSTVFHWLAKKLDDEDDLGVTSIYQEVPPGTVNGVLNAVRNRIVEFTLSIEAEYSDIDAVPVGSHPIPQEKVEEKFQVIIMGQGHAISLGGSGSAMVQNIEHQVVAGDLTSLKSFLLSQGVDEEDLKSLNRAIQDASVEDLDDEQSRLRHWVDDVAGKMSAGGKELVKVAVKEAILLSIRYYFGNLTEGSTARSTTMT